jgi:hypothetical protein
MPFLVGQGLYGKIKFADGALPAYDRMYLIVSVTSDEIGTINVSSLAGKEYKLLRFPHNKEIVRHNPPFPKRSFAKLDSLTHIPISDAQKMRVLAHGQTLDSTELRSILDGIRQQ